METLKIDIAADGLAYNMVGASNDALARIYIKTKTFYELEALRQQTLLINRLFKADSEFFILDAGANIGNHTLYYAGRFPKVNVFAFEMNPITYAYLQSNVNCSGLGNIQTYNLGLSDRVGRCGVLENPENPSTGAQLDLSVNKGNVQLVTVDEWYNSEEITGLCALLKLDVEGHEYNALLGAKEFLTHHKPLICSEIKEPHEFSRILDYLGGLGYTVVYADDDALPNFLFCHYDLLHKVFTVDEINTYRERLCARVVDAWQLHRKILHLRNDLANLKESNNAQ